MNHPRPEEWVPYLFGEAKAEARQRLHEHLQSCLECRAEIQRWKRGLRQLEAWQPRAPSRPRDALAAVVKWATAVAVVLLVGFGFILGRLAGASADAAKLRAAIGPQIEQELRREVGQMLREELAKSASATLAASGEQTRDWLAQYARRVAASLEAERAERITECLSLKKDVDTLAVNADAGLRNTEQRLAQLADYGQPTAFSNPPNHAPVHN